MHLPRLAHPRIAAAASALALLVLAAGCASEGDRPRPPKGAARARPFAPIAGQETFFQGQITADVLVGALTGFEPGARGAGSDGGPGGGGGHRRRGGGPGGMPPGGGGGLGGGGFGGMNGPDEGADRSNSQELRRADAMGSAPVMIHLRFTNRGTEQADLVIADFLSPLGNFVVHPDKLALEPGQSIEVEPMTSRLAGEIASGEVALSLKLAGVTETKTVTLALKADAPPDSTAQAPNPPKS